MTTKMPPDAGPELASDDVEELVDVDALVKIAAAPALEAEPVEAAQPATEAAEPAADEAEQPLPSFTEQLADQLGGVRGLVESGVPVVVFVLANIMWALRPALAIAVGSAVAIAAWRLTRKQPIRHAINGIFGIAIGAIIAWKTGSAKNFYLPGILLSFGYGLALLVSVAVRRPLVGWVWSLLVARGSTEWRGNPRLVRTFSWLTVVWAVTYLAKTLVQALVFQHTAADDPATALGVLRIALGYPPYLLLIAITVWAIRRTQARTPISAEAAEA